MASPFRHTRPVVLLLTRALGAFALALVSLACSSTARTSSDDVTIGLLLPFTGASSGTASNFERAVLYAADRVNAGGGVHGHRLRIISADTHSEVVAAQHSVEQLVDAGAVVVVGPESAEIAAEVGPYLAARQVAFLSPLVGAANDDAIDCSTPWFRLAPSAHALGEALAKQAVAQNVHSIVLMYARTAYDEALRDAVSARFTSLQGEVRLVEALDPNAQSYAGPVSAALEVNADAIVLTSSPRAAALVVDEFDALSAVPPRWFLSPLLKTDLLLQNVAPEALEGAHGVAPKIYDITNDFEQAFGKRWQGDQPLEGAYFYYDAIALLAFALDRAPSNADGTYDLSVLASAIRTAAAPPGTASGWNEIEQGLVRQRAGSAIYFSGLTGPLLLNGCGARALGSASTWQVHAGHIINDAD